VGGVSRNGFLFIAVLGLVFPALSQTSESAGVTAQIVVRVYDLAGIPNSTLTEALKVTEKIFRRAKIETVWLDCSTSKQRQPHACGDPQAPTTLTLEVVPQSIAARYDSPKNGFGFATLPRGQFGVQACVYFHRARELSRRRPQSLGSILGHMMAHEVGHLLLAYSGHVDGCIMAGLWGPNELRLAANRLLRFLPQHTETMRANMAARLQAEQKQEVD
jgi:hypothetical protein